MWIGSLDMELNLQTVEGLNFTGGIENGLLIGGYGGIGWEDWVRMEEFNGWFGDGGGM